MKAKICRVLALSVALNLLVNSCTFADRTGKYQVFDSSLETKIVAGDLIFKVIKQGFRFSFAAKDGSEIVRAHPHSGLLLGSKDDYSGVTETVFKGCSEGRCRFLVTTKTALQAAVTLKLSSHHAQLTVRTDTNKPITIAARINGAGPGYGLGDRASYHRNTTDITGYISDNYQPEPETGFYRTLSNFAIYPSHKFALVLLEPGLKLVRSTEKEILQAAINVEKVDDLHFFFGSPKQIYASFLKIRNGRGYPVMLPKYQFFGVGWEAWGALAWNTNQKSVEKDVTRYLQLGYPLQWAVIGSGFWPQHHKRYCATTSFGMWDEKRYPSPEKLIDYFHRRGLKVFIGLRIAFITDGPFSAEGVEKGYFIKENGKPRVFEIAFPKRPVYLLDTENTKAVQWYVGLAKKWTDCGIDGFKEDLYGWHNYVLKDNILNPVNEAMMQTGLFIMGRNTYIGSPADIHRINDFNHDEEQDRGPINSLILAYSGFPLVYPDVVGGTLANARFKTVPEFLKKYIMRNAQWASVHPAMAIGIGPWRFKDSKVEKVLLNAARLHDRLQPYIYSQAVRFYREGYPWPLAPLPVAFPDDPNVYGRENVNVRGYQWMIGDSLLAVPLYGDDYATADTRDIYLPKGNWIDYDTGKKYRGPKLLKDFSLPVGKTPLFVGGTGIVVEKKNARLYARIYPVTNSAETIFWHKDAKTLSNINIVVTDWTKPEVIDVTTGKKVRCKCVNHAYEFVFEPGHNYQIR